MIKERCHRRGGKWGSCSTTVDYLLFHFTPFNLRAEHTLVSFCKKKSDCLLFPDLSWRNDQRALPPARWKVGR
ncbi:unnamed protein product, partial [Bodo saltans]